MPKEVNETPWEANETSWEAQRIPDRTRISFDSGLPEDRREHQGIPREVNEIS